MPPSFSSPLLRPAYRPPVLLRLGILLFLLVASGSLVQGQSLRKLERRAINRTHLTFVNGDTVQRFTVTYARPAARPGRFYYWQGPTQILRTAGAYDGRLLSGAYQLTSRNGNLLGSGTFSKGLKTGQWRTWRPDGTPSSSSAWHQGRQRGKTRYYDVTGQRLKVLPPVPVATTQPARPRFWQPVYWRAALRQRQLRRQQKAQLPAVPPLLAAVPTKETVTKAKAGKKTKVKIKPTTPQPPAPTGPSNAAAPAH